MKIAVLIIIALLYLALMTGLSIWGEHLKDEYDEKDEHPKP
jgi:hypothetical protein